MENIVVAQIEDAPGLLQQLQEMAMETENKALDQNIVEPAIKFVINNKEFGFYLLYKFDNRIIGSLLIIKEINGINGVIWWFQSVYVKKENRKKGIFKQLYKRVEEMANNIPLKLYVETENISAQNVYQSLGMKETKELVYEDDFIFHPIQYKQDIKDIEYQTQFVIEMPKLPHSLLELQYNEQNLEKCLLNKQLIQVNYKQESLIGLFFVEYSDWRLGLNIWFYDFISSTNDDKMIQIMLSILFQSIKVKQLIQPEVKCIRIILMKNQRIQQLLEEVGMKESHYFVYQN